MNVNFGEKKTLTLKNQSVRGISFNTHLFCAEDSSVVATDFDANGVTVIVEFKIGGQTFSSVATQLNTLAMESSFSDGLWAYSNPKKFNHVKKLLTNGSQTVEALVPMIFDFGTVVNLKGADECKVTIRSDKTVLGVTIDTDASFIEVEALEGVGAGSFLPVLNVETVTSGNTTLDFSLGGNVQGITLLDLNSTDVQPKPATCPWSTLNLMSDRYSVSDAFVDMVLKRDSSFVVADLSDVRGNNFQPWASYIPLQDVRLKGTLVTSAVVGGQTLVVVRTLISSPALKQRADSMRRRHQVQNNRDMYGVSQ